MSTIYLAYRLLKILFIWPKYADLKAKNFHFSHAENFLVLIEKKGFFKKGKKNLLENIYPCQNMKCLGEFPALFGNITNSKISTQITM